MSEIESRVDAGTPTPDQLDLDATHLAIEERVGWLLTEVRIQRAERDGLRAQRQAALDLCDEADTERRKVDYDDWESGYLKGREHFGDEIRAALGATE